VPEAESYNPSEFIHKLVIQKLGKPDYTSEEYSAAWEEIAAQFPEAAEMAKPGAPVETKDQELADRATKILLERGNYSPTADEYGAALEQAQTEASSYGS
jgi:hypothetical protein